MFARTWNFVGHVGDVREAGDYFTTSIAGEPIVVARDRQGELRAFANVCRHRAGPVAEGKGRRRSFVCAYHGWCYGLDGRLVSARKMESHPTFDGSSVRLREYRVDVWEPFVFVSLSDDVPPLADYLGDLPRFAEAWMSEAREFSSYRDWDIACNWKAFGENYCEGYHLPFVHPGFSDAVGVKEYRTRVASAVVSEQSAPEGHPRGPGTRVAKAFGCSTAEARGVLPPLSSLAEGQQENYFFYYVFPNFALNLGPDGISVIRLDPRGPERCHISYWTWFPPETMTRDVIRNALVILFGHEIQDEDQAIVEKVQRNYGSRAYAPGPYAPGWESAVYHFSDLVSIFTDAATPREALDRARARYPEHDYYAP